MHDEIIKLLKSPKQFQEFGKGHVQFESPEHLDHHLKNSTFSILSAEKPPKDRDLAFHSLSDEDKAALNKSRSKELEKHLKSIGATYHKVLGHYGEPENSFMVYHTNGITKEHLNDLADKFKQDSILHWDKGSGHLLKAHGEEGVPRAIKTGKEDLSFQGHNISSEHEDYYTQPKELGQAGRFQTIAKSEQRLDFGFTVKDAKGRTHKVKFLPRSFR